MNILQACDASNIEKVRELIAKGHDVHVRNVKNGDSLLHTALTSNIELFKLLLENGVDVNAVNNDGDNLLHVAFLYEAVECDPKNRKLHFKEYVNLSIDAGIDINRKNVLRLSPLHISVTEDLDEYTRILLNNENIDLNVQDSDGNTPIHELAKLNKIEILKEAVKKGPDLNIENCNKLTPFEIALKAEKFAFDCFKFLSSENIDINHQSKGGNTVLHTAIKKFKFRNVPYFLIDHENINVNIENDCGDTAVHLAIKEGDISILSALIQNNANLNIANNDDKTPLDLSLDNRRILALLLSSNVNVNRQNSNGDTILHAAVRIHDFKNNKSVNELLRFDNVDIKLQNNDGYTPLMLAVERNDVECVKLLLDRNCEVNFLTNGGNTALMIAARSQEMSERRNKIIDMLINTEKCDLYIVSNEECKQSCLHKAVLNNNFYIAKCLIEKNVKLGD
ncbi:hypothetical protein B4U80_00584, partial [Leptotrombidium deliense]